MTTAPKQAEAAPGFAFFIFCIYTFVLVGRPQDFFHWLTPFRLALAFTFLASIATVVRRERAKLSIWQFAESKLYFALFAVMCVTIPFSVYRRASFEFVILVYVANMVFFTLFVIHVNTLAKCKRIVFVLVLAAFLFGLSGILQGAFLGGRYSTGSQIFDPNDVAFVALSLFPFCMCALWGTFRILTKAMALVAVVLSVLLTLYTGSRGGFIGLVAMLLLFACLRIKSITKTYKIVMFVVLTVAAFANLDKINLERFQTLGDLGDDYNLSDEFGRTQIWKRGMLLFQRDPLTGVGVNNFAQAIGEMRKQERLREYWQAPHNSYMQILTETGVFGAAAFVALIVVTLRNFNKLRRRRDTCGLSGLETLPGLLLVGFVAQLVIAFFISQAYSVLFTLFFALSASLTSVTRAIQSEDVRT